MDGVYRSHVWRGRRLWAAPRLEDDAPEVCRRRRCEGRGLARLCPQRTTKSQPRLVSHRRSNMHAPLFNRCFAVLRSQIPAPGLPLSPHLSSILISTASSPGRTRATAPPHHRTFLRLLPRPLNAILVRDHSNEKGCVQDSLPWRDQDTHLKNNIVPKPQLRSRGKPGGVSCGRWVKWVLLAVRLRL